MFKALACGLVGFVFFIGTSDFARAGDVEFRNTFESYFSYGYAEILDSDLNPGNRIFGLADQTGVLDLRDSFDILTDKTKWSFRPRFTSTTQEFEKKYPSETTVSTMGKLDLSAGYFEWDISRRFKSVLGLQVFQWGPGEFMTPSNVFFKFAADQKSFFFLRKGKMLARLNYSPTPDLSFILISEPMSNNDAPALGEKKFEPKSTLKGEYRFKNGSSVGALVGSENPENIFFGEYFTWYLTDAISIYGDLQHTTYSSWNDPVYRNTGYVEISQFVPNQKELFTAANWGLRWEGRVDFRAEWYYNGLSWGEEGLKAALQGLKYPNPYFAKNLYSFYHSGHELPGQSYIYMSLRVPDLGKKKDASLFIRNILSLQDSSGVAQFCGEKAIGDSWTGYFEVMQSYGKDMSEMRLLYGTQLGAGARFAL